ncbi:hypothetical protein D3C71_328880 [compost metagenome]
MRARLIAAALVVAALLAGCAITAPAPAPIVVPTPVPCRAAAERPPRPELPLSTLAPGAQPSVVVRAYAATVEMLKGYGEALELLLDSCKP